MFWVRGYKECCTRMIGKRMVIKTAAKMGKCLRRSIKYLGGQDSEKGQEWDPSSWVGILYHVSLGRGKLFGGKCSWYGSKSSFGDGFSRSVILLRTTYPEDIHAAWLDAVFEDCSDSKSPWFGFGDGFRRLALLETFPNFVDIHEGLEYGTFSDGSIPATPWSTAISWRFWWSKLDRWPHAMSSSRQDLCVEWVRWSVETGMSVMRITDCRALNQTYVWRIWVLLIVNIVTWCHRGCWRGWQMPLHSELSNTLKGTQTDSKK